MKTFIKTILVLLFTLNIQVLLAQSGAGGAPPPPPPGGTGGTTNQPASGGGGAPIGGGLGILLALGAAYGGSKIYSYWKTNNDGELED